MFIIIQEKKVTCSPAISSQLDQTQPSLMDLG